MFLIFLISFFDATFRGREFRGLPRPIVLGRGTYPLWKRKFTNNLQ